jgi:hypothetical protein
MAYPKDYNKRWLETSISNYIRDEIACNGHGGR